MASPLFSSQMFRSGCFRPLSLRNATVFYQVLSCQDVLMGWCLIFHMRGIAQPCQNVAPPD
jgi:hypothetical protein